MLHYELIVLIDFSIQSKSADAYIWMLSLKDS